MERRAAGLTINAARPSLASWRTGRGPRAGPGCSGREDSVRPWQGWGGTFWAFLTSFLQEGLIGPGLPFPWGKAPGRVAQCPVLQARPLCCSGTGAGAGKARLPNRQIKHVLRALASKGHQQSVWVWFGSFFLKLILSISKIARQ